MTRLIAGLALCLALSTAAGALTIRVPEDAATIPSAIQRAVEGDTVLLAPGTYHQRCYILSKNIVLRSAMGADVTTLDGQRGGNVLTLSGVGRSTIIEGLTITGGASTQPESLGAGIYVNQGSPTIQRCRLVGNRARSGGGIASYFFSEPLVRDCWIANNSGGAVDVETDTGDAGTSNAEFYNTVIVHNEGWGLKAYRGARVLIRNCTIAYNSADGVRTDEHGRISMKYSIVSFNGLAGVMRYDPTGCFDLSCNDVFGNPSGPYVGYSPTGCFTGRGSGDTAIDPCFQSEPLEDFHLQPGSPLCAYRPFCGVVGAYADPCVDGATCVTAVTPSTWGGMKVLYRD